MTQLANAFEQGRLSARDKVCLGVESTGKDVICLKIKRTTPDLATAIDVNFMPF